MNVEQIDLSICDSDPDQPRKDLDLEDTKRLALSIRDLGQLQPAIVCRNGEHFLVIDGHRRREALLLLKKATMSSIVLDQRPDADTLLMTQLAANCLRLDLKPTEKARAYQRLIESRGWSRSELAAALHVSKSAVTQCPSYLELSEAERQALDAGRLAGSTAYCVARAPDEATKASMLESASQGTLRRDDAQRGVRRSGRTGERIVFQMEAASITVTSPGKLELGQVIVIWQRLIAECRKGSREGLDVGTLCRVMSDKSRAAD